MWGCNPNDDTTNIVACLRQVDSKTLINSGDNFKVSDASIIKFTL
jgi:hypothetical protein